VAGPGEGGEVRRPLHQDSLRAKDMVHRINALIEELALAERSREAAWARVRELEKEKDEAREIATHLMKHSVDCWAYQAELMEAYPWMRE
jgi:hypothetical protein